MSHTEVKPEAMQIRFYQPEDYPVISSWWERHGMQPPPPATLPPLGIVSHKQGDPGKPISCHFLYMDNGGTGVAFLDWLCLDPDAEPVSGLRAIDAGVSFLMREAASMGYHTIFAFMRHPKLVRMARRHGFQPHWKGVISMAATIQATKEDTHGT